MKPAKPISILTNKNNLRLFPACMARAREERQKVIESGLSLFETGGKKVRLLGKTLRRL
jgi:hypothetical protein